MIIATCSPITARSCSTLTAKLARILACSGRGAGQRQGRHQCQRVGGCRAGQGRQQATHMLAGCSADCVGAAAWAALLGCIAHTSASSGSAASQGRFCQLRLCSFPKPLTLASAVCPGRCWLAIASLAFTSGRCMASRVFCLRREEKTLQARSVPQQEGQRATAEPAPTHTPTPMRTAMRATAKPVKFRGSRAPF